MCQSGAVQSLPPIIYTRQKLYFEFSSGRFDIHPNFHLSSTEVGFWIFYFFKEAPCYQTGSCLVFFCVQRATRSVSKSSPGQRQHMDFLPMSPQLIPGCSGSLGAAGHPPHGPHGFLWALTAGIVAPAFIQVWGCNRGVRTSHGGEGCVPGGKAHQVIRTQQSLDHRVLTANFLCGHRQAMGCSLSQFTSRRSG